MYEYMTSEQLLLMLDCLVQAYDFAKSFNVNHEQRNLLWKTGIKLFGYLLLLAAEI